MPRGNLAVGLGRLLERKIFGERDDALQHRVESLEPLEVKLGQLDRADLARSDQRGELDDRQERELFRRARPRTTGGSTGLA